jgi:hypothetical protein
MELKFKGQFNRDINIANRQLLEEIRDIAVKVKNAGSRKGRKVKTSAKNRKEFYPSLRFFAKIFASFYITCKRT